MAVHIRLARVGATKRPAYRVIAIDSRRSRDGRALEILGFYDPLTDPITVKLDDERIANWMARGARPSAAVQRLMKVATAPPRPAGSKGKGAGAVASSVTADVAPAAKPRPARRAAKAATIDAETAAPQPETAGSEPEEAEALAQDAPEPETAAPEAEEAEASGVETTEPPADVVETAGTSEGAAVEPEPEPVADTEQEVEA